jgi:hypothetical protein
MLFAIPVLAFVRLEVVVEVLLQNACLLGCYVVSVRGRPCMFLTPVSSGRSAQKLFATQIQNCKYLIQYTNSNQIQEFYYTE